MQAIATALIQPAAASNQTSLLTQQAGNLGPEQSGTVLPAGQPLADFATLLTPMTIAIDGTLPMVDETAMSGDPALLDIFAGSTASAAGDAILDLPTADSLQALLEGWGAAPAHGADTNPADAYAGGDAGGDTDVVAELMTTWMPAAPVGAPPVDLSLGVSLPVQAIAANVPTTGIPAAQNGIVPPSANLVGPAVATAAAADLSALSPWQTQTATTTVAMPASAPSGPAIGANVVMDAANIGIKPAVPLAPMSQPSLPAGVSTPVATLPAIDQAWIPGMDPLASAINQSQAAVVNQGPVIAGQPALKPATAPASTHAFAIGAALESDASSAVQPFLPVAVQEAALNPVLAGAASSAPLAPAAPAAPSAALAPAGLPHAVLAAKSAALPAVTGDTPDAKAEPFGAMLRPDQGLTVRAEAVAAPQPLAPPAAIQAATRAESPTPMRSDANPVERAVAHQVARAIVQHLPDGGTRMVMRLTPPELGTVRVEFITRDGIMSARLLAEDDGVRQALDRALPHIRAEVRGEHPMVDITVDRGEQRQAWSDGQQRHDRRDSQTTDRREQRDGEQPVFSLDGATAAPITTATLRTEPVLGGRASAAGVDAFA